MFNKKDKILVSACLLGRKVRYNGNALYVSSDSADIFNQWVAQDKVISVCPEVDAGMDTPRIPAEISGGDGYDVWEETALVIGKDGRDLTPFFKKGAKIAMDLCRRYNIRVAVLAENSPSCGSSAVYDGSFANKKIAGAGVTTALLRNNGIEVFSQNDIQDADNALHRRSRLCAGAQKKQHRKSKMI